MYRDDLAPSGQRFADDLEGQNDERLEGLTAKVKLLKDVSPPIVSGYGQQLNWSVRYLWVLATK